MYVFIFCNTEILLAKKTTGFMQNVLVCGIQKAGELCPGVVASKG